MRTVRSAAVSAAVTLCLLAPTAAAAETPDTPAMPDYTRVLAGFEGLWKPQGENTLRGTVTNEAALDHNDEMISWINQHASADQRFRALQNSKYSASGASGYDQSMTIADGLGTTLGAIYVKGRLSGALPLTNALINSRNGSVGHAVETNDFKGHFSYPRPFLRASSAGTVCASKDADASSLVGIRRGEAWADGRGDLTITQVPKAVDTTHEFAADDVTLDPGYAGLCRSGAFPSGHTATAYEAGSVLATMLPEVAPGILARASEAGNNRIVLGAHYPLDVIGGRITGQSALATLWADAAFRDSTILPARTELRDYLTRECTAKLGVKTLAECVAKDTPYKNDPYSGASVPGGTTQKVSDRASALAVYTERLSYGFASKMSGGESSSVTMTRDQVPATAAALLRTTYPTLTDDQRRDVIAQTAIAAGNPLALGSGEGWQRMNLAKAMTATVRLDGAAVTVVETGGTAQVEGDAPGGPTSRETSAHPSRDSALTWLFLGLVMLGVALAAAFLVTSRRRPR